MNHSLYRSTCLLITGLALSASAYASEGSGVYIGAQVGSSNLKANDSFLSTKGASFSASSPEDQGVLSPTLSLGYNFKSQFDLPVRFDISYTYRDELEAKNPRIVTQGEMQASMDAVTNTQINTVLAQLYVDFHNSSNVTPYLFAGAGYAIIESTTTMIDPYFGNDDLIYSDTQLVYAFGGGLNVAIQEGFDLTFMARYIDLGEIKASSTETPMSYTSHYETMDFMIGVNYSF